MFFVTFLRLVAHFLLSKIAHIRLIIERKGVAVIYNKYGLNKRNVLAKLAINMSCERARAISMQMLAANHTPNERSSDNCNSNSAGNGNNNWGNNWQLRVAQSLEAERQLTAYTQLPQTRPDPAKNMTSNGKQRAITPSDTTELRPKQRQSKRRENREQSARAEAAHGRASWALKAHDATRQLTDWVNESVGKMRWMQQPQQGWGWALEWGIDFDAIAIDIS